jgi:hypothetical protein
MLYQYELPFKESILNVFGLVHLAKEYEMICKLGSARNITA